MNKTDQRGSDLLDGFDASVQSKKVAFDSHQLVECASCRRRNPPNRAECLYCGFGLEGEVMPAVELDFKFRRPNTGELGGVLLVSVPHDKQDSPNLLSAARLLSMDPKDLQTILDASVPLPICHIEGEKEASSLQNLLEDAGVKCTMVSDESLQANVPPVRLAGIRFLEKELVFTSFNSHEQLVIPNDQILLLVEGFISVSRVEQTEKRKGHQSHIQDESSAIFDDAILDIYTVNDATGFRVLPTGFDYSALENKKTLIAAENLKELTRRLSSACTSSRTVSGFRSFRESLGRVWDAEVRRESNGLRVTGFGKREIGSVLSTSNLQQFTKFSRLQRLLT